MLQTTDYHARRHAATIRRFLATFSVLGAILLLSACAVEMPLISAPQQTLTQVLANPSEPDVVAFVDELAANLVERNYAQLQGMMDNPFQLAWWQAADVERPAAVALLTLRDRYLGVGSAVAVRDAHQLSALGDGLGIATDDTVELVDAIYLAGLGVDQHDEALLFIARGADGALFWHSILLADQGFAADNATATTNATAAVMANGNGATAIASRPADQFLVELRNVDGEAIAGATTLPQVQIRADAMSATVRGVIQPTQARSYLLNPLAAEELVFTLRTVTPAVNFTITGIEDGQLYKADDDTLLWQGQLPPTQEYLVTVSATVAQPFELAITASPDPLAVDIEPAVVTTNSMASVETP